jgi:uncharacterized membrane protein YbhN (UPF0104 family)
MAITLANPSRRTALHSAVLVGCAALLAYQVHDVDLGALFGRVRAGWVLAAGGGVVVSLAAAAHNISAFAPLRLRAVDTMRAQLAIGGLRMIAPSAVSTPAIGTRFLNRNGLPMATAVTVLAVAQTAQLVMTIVVVGAIALVASAGPAAPSTTTLLVGAGTALLLVVAAVAGRRVPAVQRFVATAARSVRDIGAHLRDHPTRVLTGLGASAALTLAHVFAFACCVHAVGGDASVLALTAVYLGAASAGSLVPTPGGVGAVESALIGGLVATGLTAQVATAAALLSRLLTVWVPAVPGVIALRGLRRDGLL